MENFYGQKLGRYFAETWAKKYSLTFKNPPSFLMTFWTLSEFIRYQKFFFPLIILSRERRIFYVRQPHERIYQKIMDVKLFFCNFAHFFEDMFTPLYTQCCKFQTFVLWELEIRLSLTKLMLGQEKYLNIMILSFVVPFRRLERLK